VNQPLIVIKLNGFSKEKFAINHNRMLLFRSFVIEFSSMTHYIQLACQTQTTVRAAIATKTAKRAAKGHILQNLKSLYFIQYFKYLNLGFFYKLM